LGRRLGLDLPDRTLAALVAGEACLELLDDKVQQGYGADQRNDFVTSGRAWLGAWSDVLRMCDAIGAGSIREFDDRFPMTQSLFNWCQDLEMALQNGGEHDPELRTARLEMAAEWLRRFGPSRRGQGVPAAGGKGPATRRTAEATCHSLGGVGRACKRIACREAVDHPSREDRTKPAVPLRKREEVQEVLRCPCVGMTGQVRRLDPPGLRSGSGKGDAPGRSALPAAHHAGMA
jgi:hypothetical protein